MTELTGWRLVAAFVIVAAVIFGPVILAAVIGAVAM